MVLEERAEAGGRNGWRCMRRSRCILGENVSEPDAKGNSFEWFLEIAQGIGVDHHGEGQEITGSLLSIGTAPRPDAVYERCRAVRNNAMKRSTH